MKNKIFLLITFITLFSTTSVFASPELSAESSGLSSDQASLQILSSDSNDVKVQNVENVIENKVDLANYIEPIKIISGINDSESTRYNSRTCAFYWAFAAGYLIWLYEYGQKIKRKRKFETHWFSKPLQVAALVYVMHAIVHIFFASPIFLEYYWMILFDEVLLGYIYYYYFLKIGIRQAKIAAVKKSNLMLTTKN